MKCLIIAFLLFWFVPAITASQCFPVLGASEYCDTEIVTNVPFAITSIDNAFTLTMALNATSNNCAMIAFGDDQNADGVLSREETELNLGWDSGAWVFADYRSNDRWCVLRQNGKKTLCLTILLDDKRCGKKLMASDNDGEVFAFRVMPTAFNPAWNLACIVARGTLPPEAETIVNFKNFGTVILLR